MKGLVVTAFLMLSLLGISCAEQGFLEKLTSGFKFAGKLLGIDHVSEVTQLISKAFSSNRGEDTKENKEDNENTNNNGIFSNFLRIFGFDSKKLAAIAVNGIIFMAQLISTSLAKQAPPKALTSRKLETEDPFDWLSNNSKVKNILDDVKNSDLSSFLIEHIKENSLDEDTDCIQLLVCKLSPFIKKMQESLKRDPEKVQGKAIFFKNLPSLDEISDTGDACEEKHPYCRVIY